MYGASFRFDRRTGLTSGSVGNHTCPSRLLRELADLMLREGTPLTTLEVHRYRAGGLWDTLLSFSRD